MTKFFEYTGFVATIVISGFFTFLWFGHTKKLEAVHATKTPKEVKARVSEAGIEPDETEQVSEFRKESPYAPPAGEHPEKGGDPLPEPRSMSSARIGKPSGSADLRKARSSASVAAPAEKAPKNAITTTENGIEVSLQDLYEDEAFVESTIKKWKSKVQTTASAQELRPAFLMANILIRSYTGTYTERQFGQDADNHAGDALKSSDAALKTYPNARMMANLVRLYRLEERFQAAPPIMAAKSEPKPKTAARQTKKDSEKEHRKTSTKRPTSEVIPVSAKTETPKTTASERAFREIVARQFHFDTWAGLQRLGDEETKARAAKKVRALMVSSRIR